METTNIGYWEQVLATPTIAYQEFFDAERKYLLEKISQNAKVLDIGCGDGRNIKTISKKTTNVIGIDNDGHAINDAKKNFSDTPSIMIVHSEANKLPFEKETFDIVTVFNILENLNTQKEEVLRECSRVLKNDGKLLLTAYADTALEERIEMYNSINVPIEKIDRTTVIFNKSIGANVSEQFSKEQLGELAHSSGLEISDIQKVGNIAYLCTLVKAK
jgi:ubiquinone/menaquinone biosynthesis C-methylase UbiE